jgi:hypothetical protein
MASGAERGGHSRAAHVKGHRAGQEGVWGAGGGGWEKQFGSAKPEPIASLTH